MSIPSPQSQIDKLNRRCFLNRSSLGLGASALSTLLPAHAGSMFPARAKRVIYMCMSGGPSHVDLFDYKPIMRKLHGTELPDSIRQGQRTTTMTSGQATLPCVAPMFDFKRRGASGGWVSDLLPHTAAIIDDITVIKSMHTEAINHTPAINTLFTGSDRPGKPSMGAWLSYGLGSENQNMPAFVVMLSYETGDPDSLSQRLWGSAFLPSEHQGVNLRPSGDPILFLSNPDGVTRGDRRNLLDSLARLNEIHDARVKDAEISARISQYEMAFRMQAAAPDILNIDKEPASTFKLYGEAARKPGTFASNCLRASRLAESGVRFIQLIHRGWDHHSNLPKRIRTKCRETDQSSAALIIDLKQRGLLDDTLVVWGGEFGRTFFSQGKLTKTNHGRDHHGRCFTMWAAGGGVKAGFEYGATDDYAYNIVKAPVHIRDLNATILHQLGIDDTRLSFRHQGLDETLTGVEDAHVVKGILS
jgi:hypothetical protein